MLLVSTLWVMENGKLDSKGLGERKKKKRLQA